MKRLLFLPLLALPAVAQAQTAGIAQKIAAIIANPTKTGKCKKDGVYTDCSFAKTDQYFSINGQWDTPANYAYIVVMPAFTVKDLAPQTTEGKRGFFKITAGPLKNHYVRFTKFKSGLQQIELRSSFRPGAVIRACVRSVPPRKPHRGGPPLPQARRDFYSRRSALRSSFGNSSRRTGISPWPGAPSVRGRRRRARAPLP